ncbi:hypothetical protein J3R82DRAFT_3207 [Butyriboletus roseoflavus]|nr:hypothetical protein J3R82DRAFT_3207 [Butyriboletus roseoflavus]
MDDESDQPSFSFDGTESKCGYRVLDRSSYRHCVYQASPSSVSIEPQSSVVPPDDWPAHPRIHTHSPATTAQSPFLLPPTLRATPIPLYANGSSPPHFRYNTSFDAHPLISEPDPRTVARPILTGHTQYEGGLIDAHPYHHDLPFGFPQGNYMVDYPCPVPSPVIAMPIVPTSPGAGASSHMDPVLPPHLTLGWSLRHPTATFQHLPSFDSTASLSSSGNFDSELYSSPSPPLSTGNHALAVWPPGMLDQIQIQPYITSPSGLLYTLTVPLEAVEFPPVYGSGEVQFFQCRWANCGIWITSEKEAVKNHLIYTHNVVLKGKSADSARCEWVGCSSSVQRNGLVRHFLSHLGLKWLCSVCSGAYARQDSVGFHSRREPRCEEARAISHPSAVAYSARTNEDNTVTLTKIVQP